MKKRDLLEDAIRRIAENPDVDVPDRWRVDDLLAMPGPPDDPHGAAAWRLVRSMEFEQRTAEAEADREAGREGVTLERPDLPRKVIFSPSAIRDLMELDLDEEVEGEEGASRT